MPDTAQQLRIHSGPGRWDWRMGLCEPFTQPLVQFTLKDGSEVKVCILASRVLGPDRRSFVGAAKASVTGKLGNYREISIPVWVRGLYDLRNPMGGWLENHGSIEESPQPELPQLDAQSVRPEVWKVIEGKTRDKVLASLPS